MERQNNRQKCLNTMVFAPCKNQHSSTYSPRYCEQFEIPYTLIISHFTPTSAWELQLFDVIQKCFQEKLHWRVICVYDYKYKTIEIGWEVFEILAKKLQKPIKYSHDFAHISASTQTILLIFQDNLTFVITRQGKQLVEIQLENYSSYTGYLIDVLI